MFYKFHKLDTLNNFLTIDPSEEEGLNELGVQDASVVGPKQVILIAELSNQKNKGCFRIRVIDHLS